MSISVPSPESSHIAWLKLQREVLRTRLTSASEALAVAVQQLKAFDNTLLIATEQMLSAKTSPTHPNETELAVIRGWPERTPGWLAHCAALWNTNCGKARQWDESVEFVTGGWSGNEAIIAAMRSNAAKWAQSWDSTHRGGLYVFDPRKEPRR